MIYANSHNSDDEVVKKSLTFCLSPGRVGSDYLALLLNLTVDTYAVHEPYPQLAGFPLRQVLKEPLEDRFVSIRLLVRLMWRGII